jgi:hypothetical protein
MSGVFYIGLGDQFNPDQLQTYPLLSNTACTNSVCYP